MSRYYTLLQLHGYQHHSSTRVANRRPYSIKFMIICMCVVTFVILLEVQLVAADEE